MMAALVDRLRAIRDKRTTTPADGRVITEAMAALQPKVSGGGEAAKLPAKWRGTAKIDALQAQPTAPHHMVNRMHSCADELQAALSTPQPRPEEMSPEFTDSARAALAWVLYHHQGGSSAVGQPIRFALGMGAHDPLPDWRIAEAKRWAEMAGSKTSDFHSRTHEPAPTADGGGRLAALKLLEGAHGARLAIGASDEMAAHYRDLCSTLVHLHYPALKAALSHPTPKAAATLNEWPEGMADRVKAAAQRIQDGYALRRIPADPTDVDLVLAEVSAYLAGERPPFWLSTTPQPDATLNG